MPINIVTVTQINYSLDVDDTLLRRVREKVKDTGGAFSVISDVTSNVGEKEDWESLLEDERDQLVDQRDDIVDKMNDAIQDLQDQLNEIGGL